MDLKKAGRGFVGVDTRWREQADKAIRLNQIHCTLDEQRVQVDVTCAQQGIVPRLREPFG